MISNDTIKKFDEDIIKENLDIKDVYETYFLKKEG